MNPKLKLPGPIAALIQPGLMTMTELMQQNIATTESICPECLARIPAQRILRGDDVYLHKICPEHGEFEVILWRGMPAYSNWAQSKLPVPPAAPVTEINQGCPFDCGLCPDHRQPTRTAVLEVTQQCDMRCPYCFASAGSRRTTDPTMKVIEGWYRQLLDSGTQDNIQLSGGEPTLRNDLPDIIALGKSLGFSSIQIYSNGLRLARDVTYGLRLKEAGLSTVFLQFDGTDDTIMTRLRGVKLLARKRTAIENCAKNELRVVLAPTLAPGINTENIGSIIEFALGYFPAVCGVHFQPVTYAGRYPKKPADTDRLTIPEIVRAIERQTAGRIQAGSFTTWGCANAYCSMHDDFEVMPDGSLGLWSQRVEATSTESLTTTFSISATAYQDAWTLDLERLKDCGIHTVSPDGRVVPFCAYNVSDRTGRTLYRGRKSSGAARS